VSEKLSGMSDIHCMEVVDAHVWCGCLNGTIIIWHKYFRGLVTKIQAHNEDVFCLKLIGNGVWSCSHDRTIAIWDKTTYKLVRILKQKDYITCLEPAGNKMWIGSSMGDIKILKKKDFKSYRDYKVDGAVGSMLFIAPNRMWIGTDRSIVILDTNNTTCTTLNGHTGMVHSLVKVGNNIWSCSSDKTIRVWSENGDMLKEIAGHSGRVFSLLNVGDAHVWSCSWDSSIMIWDTQNCSFIQELKGLHSDAVSALVPIEKDSKVECVWSASWDMSIGCWKYKVPQTIASKRDIIDHEGMLLKQGGEIKNWKHRYFVLSKGNLSYYEKAGDEEPIHTINIRGCPLYDEPAEFAGKRFCFSIDSVEPRKNIERRRYIMSCDSQDDKAAWMEALKMYCKDG